MVQGQEDSPLTAYMEQIMYQLLYKVTKKSAQGFWLSFVDKVMLTDI